MKKIILILLVFLLVFFFMTSGPRPAHGDESVTGRAPRAWRTPLDT